MRVKRLEIQGFKSFKDKTIVNFDHSITGIVGPNGCGKSNIVDAFFWVMGEMSYKHIRGTSSDDLIFNGSSDFAPGGMAEVTMVLETPEVDTASAPSGASVADELPKKTKYKEISVTRRVYRGGEGEYLINGLPARLRDIQELFMDTGVGAKGYSVIEQGQVGKVINAKPEDRRLLIEEAAGVAKYKARKKESLRKIEAAEGNLSRLTDILQEIDRNLGSLERQAQKARRYKEYKDELLGKEMTWGRRKHKVLLQKRDELAKTREQLEQDIAGLRARVQTLENQMETDQVARLTLGKQVDEIQNRLQTLSRELAQEESALHLSQKRQEDLAAQLQQLTHERTTLSHQIEVDRAALTTRESGLSELRSNLQAAQARVEAADADVQAARSTTEESRRAIDAVKREYFEIVSKTAQTASRKASLEARLESERARVVDLTERFQAAESKRNELQAKLVSLGQVRAEREARFQALESEIATAQGLSDELKKSLQESETAERELASLCARVASRLNSLEELAATYEGMAEGPKAILENFRERFGVLADLYDVSENFETALEGWLDTRLEQLLSNDWASAWEALNSIAQSKKGRAAITVGRLGDAQPVVQKSYDEVAAALRAAGFDGLERLDVAVQVIGDSPYAPVAADLLQNVVVVRSLLMADAANVSTEVLGGWSVVDIEGRVLEVLRGGHVVLRGGATRADTSASLLGRRRAIQALRSELSDLTSRKESVEAQIREFKNRAHEIAMELDAKRSERQRLEVDLAASRREMDQAEAAGSELSGEVTELKAEAEALQAQAAQIQTELGELSAAISGSETRKLELETKIQSEDSALAGRLDSLRGLEAQLQEARVAEASLRERVASAERELESATAYLHQTERRVKDMGDMIARLESQRAEQSGGDNEIQDRIGALHQALAREQDRLNDTRGLLEQTSGAIDAGLEEAKQVRARVDEQTQALSAAAIEVEKVNGDIAHLIQNLEEKYGPGCLEVTAQVPIQEEMTDPVVTTEMSEEEERVLAEEVEQLREKIRRLGEVNPMALEEYEILKKRYDQLVQEKQDLVQSISDLNEAIEHINTTSKDRFEKAFHAIAERFEKLFPVVFGGGRAELSLVYPEPTPENPNPSQDILDAGVEILAQPPGKKIANITLLSGGEKALTAVALIFSIFMVKPSPFCVLDEVDAPLDDANIGRFNALLKEMSRKTQFILITHNKKTMELNDTLYGVTMEKPGVSKMVSIEIS